MQSINNFFTNAQQQISMLFNSIYFIQFKFILHILASLYGFQDALLYQPNEPESARTFVPTPDLFHLPYDTITVETPDNEKLDGR